MSDEPKIEPAPNVQRQVLAELKLLKLIRSASFEEPYLPADAMSDDTLYQLVVEHVMKWGGDTRDVPMLVALIERLRKENRKIEEG